MCYIYFNKFNDFEKIDFDLENKLNALAVGKASILKELRNKNTVNKLSSRAKQTSLSTKASAGISSRGLDVPKKTLPPPQNDLPRPKGLFYTL